MGSKRREQRKDMEYERGKLMNENLEVEDNFLSFLLLVVLVVICCSLQRSGPSFSFSFLK